MEIITIQKYIHTSPRKLRLVADMVKKMEPNMALDILRITQKDAAKDLAKAIETVLANAKTAGVAGTLEFKKIEINESLKMRRFHAGTRGRVKPYKKRMSHIKIVLSDGANMKPVQQAPVKEEKVRMDDSAEKTKSEKGGRTELSKTK